MRDSAATEKGGEKLRFITARGGIPSTNYYNKVAGELGIYGLRIVDKQTLKNQLKHQAKQIGWHKLAGILPKN